jgi:hypothetical protein
VGFRVWFGQGVVLGTFTFPYVIFLHTYSFNSTSQAFYFVLGLGLGFRMSKGIWNLDILKTCWFIAMQKREKGEKSHRPNLRFPLPPPPPPPKLWKVLGRPCELCQLILSLIRVFHSSSYSWAHNFMRLFLEDASYFHVPDGHKVPPNRKKLKNCCFRQ